MATLERPQNLISYTSQANLNGEDVQRIRIRPLGYGAVLAVMLLATVVMFFSLGTLEMEAIRERGELYHVSASGEVNNTYVLKIQNRTDQTRAIDLVVEGISADVAPESVDLEPQELRVVPVKVTAIEVAPGIAGFEFVARDGQAQVRVSSTFVSGPLRGGRYDG